MARKVIIDCSPGIDDAIALTVALFDPRLEVVAVTATEGQVAADVASRNVQAIIDLLDPPRLPRIGSATPLEDGLRVDLRTVNGEDGLGNAGVSVSRLHHQHPSEKILCDEVRGAPEQITLICLGPPTNLVRAFQRDPGLPSLVGRVILAGGSVTAGGNVTAAAEVNIYCDPLGARTIFRSPTTKSLVPWDVARQVPLAFGLVDELPAETSRAGNLLRRIVPFFFRAHHQIYGQESIILHRVLAVVAAIHPEMFEFREMAGDVETSGELTTGATVFDRRHRAAWRSNMEVVVDVDAAAIRDVLVRGLQEAGRATAST